MDFISLSVQSTHLKCKVTAFSLKKEISAELFCLYRKIFFVPSLLFVAM